MRRTTKTLQVRRLVLAAPLALLVVGCGAQAATTSGADDNGLACDGAREHASAMSSTFADLGKGTITTTDALGPLRTTQKDLSEDAIISSPPLKAQVQELADGLGRLRVDMASSGLVAASLTDPILAVMTQLDAACTAIGH